MYAFALTLNLAVFLGGAAVFFTRPCASIYHPAFYYIVFHGVVFVIRPIIAWARDYNSIYNLYGFYPTMDEKLTVIYAAMIGFGIFMSICMYFADQPWEFKQGRKDDIQRQSLSLPLVVTIAICLPLALVSYGSQLNQALSGTWDMVRDQDTGFAVNTTGNGYFKDAQLMAVPLSVLFAWYFRFRWWSLLPMAAFVFFRAGLGGRGPFMVGSTSLALAYLYYIRAKWPKLWMSGGLALLLLLFSQIGITRGQEIRSIITSDSGTTILQSAPERRFMEGMDFANLEYFEYLVHIIPKRTGTYDYFANNLQLFTEPVPRVLWSDKPIGSPVRFFSLFDYGNPVGMTNSLPGHGWYQLGWVGVVVWSAIFAALCAWFYRWIVRSEHRNLAMLTYLLVLPQLLITFRDGSILTPLKGSLFFLIPIALLWILQKLFRTVSYSDIVLQPIPETARGAGHQQAIPSTNKARLPLTPAERRRRLAAQNGVG